VLVPYKLNLVQNDTKIEWAYKNPPFPIWERGKNFAMEPG